MIDIAPSILAANFACLGDEIRKVKEGGVRMLHVDVMDGHFVPNISIGIPVVEALRKATDLLLDVHLMITEPERYVGAFADAGSDMISVQQEATFHLDRVLGQIRDRGLKAGAVINPGTPVSTLDDVLDKVDFVLVMSVNPGFGGQKFLPRALDKMRELRRRREERRLNFRIEVDGGLGPDTISEAVRAGAEMIVAGTSVFHTPDPAAAVRRLHQMATEALATKV